MTTLESAYGDVGHAIFILRAGGTVSAALAALDRAQASLTEARWDASEAEWGRIALAEGGGS